MCKVDKSSGRFVQYLLLCWVWVMADAMSWGSEYRGMGIYSPRYAISSEDQGEIAVFLIVVIISEIGKKLDKNYRCPVYCAVDHIHRRKCTNEEEVYYRRVNELHRSIVLDDREQPESYLRSEGGIRIECSD